MATQAVFPKSFPSEIFTFGNADGTLAYTIFQGPGTRGARIHLLTASLSDTTSRDVNLFRAKIRSTAAAMGTCAITGGNAITRSTGSFVDDGWRVGMTALLSSPTTTTNRVAAPVTAVAVGSLSFSSGTFPTNELLPAGCDLLHLARLLTRQLPSASGYANGSPARSLLEPGQNEGFDPTPGRFLVVGGGQLLVAQMASTISAGHRCDLVIDYADLND